MTTTPIVLRKENDKIRIENRFGNVLAFVSKFDTGLVFNKDHATVSHACKKVILYTEYDRDVRVKLIRILHNLGIPGSTINQYLKGN